jgi:lipopolysaccharide/colanic/teichoic acid biosynthesis glycosyltransferase
MLERLQMQEAAYKDSFGLTQHVSFHMAWMRNNEKDSKMIIKHQHQTKNQMQKLLRRFSDLHLLDSLYLIFSPLRLGGLSEGCPLCE